MSEGKGIRVTVRDLNTGEEEVTEVVDDWLLTTAGDFYLHGVQKYKNGTVVLTIKRSFYRISASFGRKRPDE